MAKVRKSDINPTAHNRSLMLSENHENADNLGNWMNLFKQNYSAIPHPTTCSNIQKSFLLENSAIPRLSSFNGAKFPYQIIFTSILNIGIPHPLTSMQKVSCYISVSLFDMDQCCFFGRTWQSCTPCWTKNASNVREPSDDETEELNITGTRLNIRLSKQVYISY